MCGAGIGILPHQRKGKFVRLMLDPHEIQVSGEILFDPEGQQRHAVHILDPKPCALQEPQAGAVEQGGHEPGRSLQALENRLDLFTGHGKAVASYGDAPLGVKSLP